MPQQKPSPFTGHPVFSELQWHAAIPVGSRDIHWEHTLGTLVRRVVPRAKRQYGDAAMKSLAEEIGAREITANRLRLAYRLADTFPGAALRELFAQAKKSGYVLKISHVRAFATVRDAARRRDVIADCFANRWNIDQLRQQIHRHQPKFSHGGVALARPASAEAALLDLVERSQQFARRLNQVWFGDHETSLARPLTVRQRRDLRKELDDAELVLRDVAKLANTAASHIQRQRTGTDQRTTVRRPKTKLRK